MVLTTFVSGRAMVARQPQPLQMSAVETGQMSSVETGQMSSVARADIFLVSTHNVDVSEISTVAMKQ